MLLRDAAEDYLMTTAITLSAKTQRWYTQKLLSFTESCHDLTLEELRPLHANRYLATRIAHINPRTGKPLSGNTLHGDAQVIKGFVQWCITNEYLVGFNFRGIVMPKPDDKVLEVFSHGQIQRLLSACAQEERPWMVARNRCIILFLLDTGVRAAELCTLSTEDVVPSQKTARIFGKGRKERTVSFGNETTAHLIRYLRRYRFANKECSSLFTSHTGRGLTPSGLDQMLYRVNDWAGLAGVRVSAHTFRHTFAVNYLMQGGDMYSLSRLLGHASVSTTQRYVRAATDSQILHQRPSVVDTLSGLR